MNSPRPRFRFAPRPAARLRGILARLDRWFELRCSEEVLAELDDDRLKDIGLAPDDVRRIRARHFR
ncbi:DUF1127 domain-containing protein [Arvimicrobium flavum]|uniref:DUF1127 domain-containing protein n=1 Tax=Arvimicrobium flavum TaxID=3393320 RepID=UPI00237ABD21|nr:DUF1127 domain-containing protein [Mesorhizobium shangrilense]